jgi:hypothetical protein
MEILVGMSSKLACGSRIILPLKCGPWASQGWRPLLLENHCCNSVETRSVFMLLTGACVDLRYKVNTLLFPWQLFTSTMPRTHCCRQHNSCDFFFERFIARKLLRIHIGTKNLQNCSRNQFAVVVPRRASVKVSTSVGDSCDIVLGWGRMNITRTAALSHDKYIACLVMVCRRLSLIMQYCSCSSCVCVPAIERTELCWYYEYVYSPLVSVFLQCLLVLWTTVR